MLWKRAVVSSCVAVRGGITWRVRPGLVLALWAAAGLGWIMAAAPGAAAATLFIADTETRNDPRALFFTPVCNARLDGPIGNGDSSAIVAKLAEFEAMLAADTGRGPERDAATGPPQFADTSTAATGFLALCLSSPGGDLAEALRISDLFQNWMTVIEEGQECISACAIIFMRAPRRDYLTSFDDTKPGRYLHIRGKLGFHAPRLEFPKGTTTLIRPEEAAQYYATAIQTIRAVTFPDKIDTRTRPDGEKPKVFEKTLVGQALGSDALPIDLMLTFLTVPPEDMYVVDRLDEVVAWGIEIYGFAPPQALSADMLRSACLNVVLARCNRSLERECSQAGLVQMMGGEGLPFGMSAIMSAQSHEKFRELFYDRPSRVPGLPMAVYRARKHAQWPKPGKPGRYTMQAFELLVSKKAAEPYDDAEPHCEIRATWRDESLIDLQIDTATGARTGDRLLMAAIHQDAPVRDTLGDFGAAYDVLHLRPWKLLPPWTTFSAIGADPWVEFQPHKDFFDNPPNFSVGGP